MCTIHVMEDNTANYAVNSARSNHSENLTEALCRREDIANDKGRAEQSVQIELRNGL